MTKPKHGQPQCYGIAQSKWDGDHDPCKQYCVQTEWQASDCEFPAVVSNSLAKIINEIVIAFAFSNSENGTASLLIQLFLVFVMTVPRERRAFSQLGHYLQESIVWYSWSGQSSSNNVRDRNRYLFPTWIAAGFLWSALTFPLYPSSFSPRGSSAASSQAPGVLP